VYGLGGVIAGKQTEMAGNLGREDGIDAAVCEKLTSSCEGRLVGFSGGKRDPITMLLPPVIGDIGEEPSLLLGLLMLHNFAHYLGFSVAVEILVLSVFEPDAFSPQSVRAFIH
jgi:hypothetical protein